MRMGLLSRGYRGVHARVRAIGNLEYINLTFEYETMERDTKTSSGCRFRLVTSAKWKIIFRVSTGFQVSGNLETQNLTGFLVTSLA